LALCGITLTGCAGMSGGATDQAKTSANATTQPAAATITSSNGNRDIGNGAFGEPPP
jgi:hypothetical protein